MVILYILHHTILVKKLEDVGQLFIQLRVWVIFGIIVNGILDVPMAGGSTAAQESKEFAGDVEVLYKITKDGRVKVKAFNRNNQNNPARGNTANYTQGVGIQYQKDFNTWGPFLKRFFSFKKEPEPQVELVLD